MIKVFNIEMALGTVMCENSKCACALAGGPAGKKGKLKKKVALTSISEHNKIIIGNLGLGNI